MGSYFQRITEQNKLSLNKPQDSDVVYYSELNEWFTGNAFRSFSLKYVIDRCIWYKVSQREHAVKQDHFLLACKQPDVSAYFDSRQMVRSVCIDICPDTVAEAFTIMTERGDARFDDYLARYFKIPEFFEAVYPVGGSQFSRKLDGLVEAIDNDQADDLVHREWFLDLIEKIICHEYGNFLALNGLNSVKIETRKEILRRLKLAREYMDAQYLSIEEVGEVATACHMSEFHFFRSFRQAFNCSPYQYILGKRLNHAKDLLQEKKWSVTEVAHYCNFPDVFTFSKAFKKRFNISPSAFHAVRRP